MNGPSPRDTRGVDRPVGPQLRAERERRGISLRKLSRAVGISPSALSQIENERSKPSVNTLYALASELGLSLDQLFLGSRSTPDPPTSKASAITAVHGVGVQSAHMRKRIVLESGVVWERLTPTSEPEVDFLSVTYEVGGASSPNGMFIRHTGREYALVLEGHLRVTVGFEPHELGPGDSIVFDSSVPHRLENVGDVPVRAIWVAMGTYANHPRGTTPHDH